ncbi:MAG: nitrate/nitrite transporter NrtS [Dehalococcoidia bacterium]|nr:nitrate/nitrite transporter NrtS [Dehalococcoidia bacterium]
MVGTILTLLIQGDIILAGKWGNALYWMIPLTYCVPFCVAAFGSLANGCR